MVSLNVQEILLAGLLTFPITTALTIAGVGAAFILIPVFTVLGIELHQAMAIALLLNALAMVSASVRYARKKLILWKLSIPLIVTTSVGAPIGVRFGYAINNDVIHAVFVAFLLFAASMMFLAKPRSDDDTKAADLTIIKGAIGAIAGLAVGFLAGLIGVGGGNIILPILVALGIPPRRAVGTTAVIVAFTSVSGFIGHIGSGSLDALLVSVTAAAAILGAILGSWLMTDRLNPQTIKKILALVLVAVAFRMIVNLL